MPCGGPVKASRRYSYMKHVPTACLLRRFFYRFFLLLLLLLTTPDCVTHLILTNFVLSLSVPSLSRSHFHRFYRITHWLCTLYNNSSGVDSPRCCDPR